MLGDSFSGTCLHHAMCKPPHLSRHRTQRMRGSVPVAMLSLLIIVTSAPGAAFADHRRSLSATSSTWWSLARLVDSVSGKVRLPQNASCNELQPAPARHVCTRLLGATRGNAAQRLAKLVVAARASLATARECRRQHGERRWNCPSFTKEGDSGALFGAYIHLKGTREAAFVHALLSASIAHEAVDACRKGHLSDCDQCSVLSREEEDRVRVTRPDISGAAKSLDDTPQTVLWKGCHANINYGLEFARKITESTEHGAWSRARKLMNDHNERAGRQMLQSNIFVRCKCHGLSGSCGIKVCWLAQPSFKKIGNLLMARFQNASQTVFNETTDTLLPADTRFIAASSLDLVYVHVSPSYCLRQPLLGLPGTKGRECQPNSNGSNNCKILCCDRGYNEQRTVKQNKCYCRFVWCCAVKCQQCSRTVKRYFCKG